MEWNSSSSICCSIIGNDGISTWSKYEYQYPSYNTRAYIVQRVREPRDNKVLSNSSCNLVRYVSSLGKMLRGTSILPRIKLDPSVVDPQPLSEGWWDSGAAYSWHKNTLKDLNDMLYWANMDNKRTKGRWTQIFSELREEDLQWMFDRFISKEVILESRRQIVIPLPGIRGILPYATFRVSWQFKRRQTVSKEAYYDTYVYDTGDDRVHDASEMFREWKGAKRMDKDIIAPDQLNVGYDKGYKECWRRIYKMSPLKPHAAFAV